ncbi:non-ribosomal peptide synthetase [Nocardia sp. CS682]|uniref:non-ribosomal peptide synthetase n=1 Tax=Nocardia sp. CS682 TaxID=1047172 RepID=UPI00107560CF|nr:non-ribosomal peptide synthetase [Nocardia sp. CS682]QBS44593.1 AMP-binding protein [Nocardia sp. CS682]
MSTLSATLRQSPTAAHTFAYLATELPDRPALRQGDIQFTYRELASSAGAVAAWLRGQGIGRGDVVATLMDRSVRCLAGVLGAWSVGAAYVHLEATDPEPRLRALLQTTGARAVLTDTRNRSRISEDGLPVHVLTDATKGVPVDLAFGLHRDDVAYLVCTSGSTGTPKAVQVSHRALLNYCAAFWERVAVPIDSFGLATTFAADLGKVSVYGALLSGARLDVYSRETTLDPVALAADLAAHPADCLTYTPSQLEALAAEGDLAALLPQRLLVVAGEAFPPRLAAAILRARPNLEVHNGYGPSEATILATMHRVTAADAHRPRVPVGTPLSGVRAVVLDDELAPVPDGTPGTLYLGGECVALGYLGDTARTEAKFVRLDASDTRFYCTDDLVIREPGGSLDYLGRADRQIKIRGNRVEPGEVEAALLLSPGVRQAVVTGERAHPDQPLELVAYVVGTAEPANLTRSLRDELPSALVPSRIMPVPHIPVTPNGKADFAALHALADSGPTPIRATDPPRTPTEQLVAGIWCEVLGRAEIGRDERFMEIGGDSFKALTVFARLRRHYPALVIAQIYAHASIADLAAALDGPTAPVPAPGRTVTVVEL